METPKQGHKYSDKYGNGCCSSVPHFIAKDILTKLKIHQIDKSKAKILLLGATFKENTVDIRAPLAPSMLPYLSAFKRPNTTMAGLPKRIV